LWEKRPDVKRKVVSDFFKVLVDDYGEVLVAAGTDK
jgi:hypothetical protein